MIGVQHVVGEQYTRGLRHIWVGELCSMFEIAIRNGTDIRGNQFTRRLNPRQDE